MNNHRPAHAPAVQAWHAETPPTEAHLGTAGELDTMSTAQIVALMNQQDAMVPAAIAAAHSALVAAIDGITARMAAGGRLVYVGAGSAGRMGLLDAAEIPPTFGVDAARIRGVIAGGSRASTAAAENVEDDEQAGADDLAALPLSAADAVVALAASGRTPYTVAAAHYARRIGAFTVGVSSNPGARLSAQVDVAVEVVVGPEVLVGSTRLKAGTAQKLVLNTISTAVMVRLGKTYRDLMVDVAPTNDKLRRRARRIVADAAGVGLAEATTALARTDGDTRAAIVLATTSVDADEAIRVAADHRSLRAALDDARRVAR